MKGRTAIVTGSTSGIGLAIAQGFAAEGMHVTLNGFGSDSDIAAAVAAVKSSFQGSGQPSTVTHIPADLTKPPEVKGLVDTHLRQFNGRLDVLCNCAGMQYVAPIGDFPDDKWETVVALNLSAAFYATKAALPAMRRNKFGRIINIASVHGLVGSANKSAYVAAKHGVVGLTKVGALETAEENITVNAVCPGWVRTPLVERQIEAMAKRDGISVAAAADRLVGEKHPSRRLVGADEIAAACTHLARPTSRGTTGTTMVVDGGWTAWARL